MFIISSACSASNDAQGVVSTQDLSTDTTVTTVLESVVEETLTPEDAQLLLARCLRDSGYDVQDPKNNDDLRSILTPIFLAADGESNLRSNKCLGQNFHDRLLFR